jgi:hypothetical protein
LPSICPSEFLVGGMKDPSVYMHCCGWYLMGCYIWYEAGRGLVVKVCVVWVLCLGVFFHVLENLMW